MRRCFLCSLRGRLESDNTLLCSAAVMAVLVFILVLVWPFVARRVTPIGVYVVGGLYTAFGLVATIGVPAVVVPAAQDSELIFVGLGTYW